MRISRRLMTRIRLLTFSAALHVAGALEQSIMEKGPSVHSLAPIASLGSVPKTAKLPELQPISVAPAEDFAKLKEENAKLQAKLKTSQTQVSLSSGVLENLYQILFLFIRSMPL